MESAYKLQIVRKDTGEVVIDWPPGKDFEQDLVVEVAKRVVAKGVGVFRTEAHVKLDIINALRELLLDLKKKV